MIRSLGHSPTRAELTAANVSGDAKFNFSQFLDVMAKSFRGRRRGNVSKEIIRAFKLYNATFRGWPSSYLHGEFVVEDGGLVQVGDLEHVMRNMGERLTGEEWCVIVKECSLAMK